MTSYWYFYVFHNFEEKNHHDKPRNNIFNTAHLIYSNNHVPKNSKIILHKNSNNGRKNYLSCLGGTFHYEFLNFRSLNKIISIFYENFSFPNIYSIIVNILNNPEPPKSGSKSCTKRPSANKKTVMKFANGFITLQ